MNTGNWWNTHCGASIRYQRKQSLQIVDHFWRCFKFLKKIGGGGVVVDWRPFVVPDLTYIIKSEVVKWKWSQRMWEVSNNMVYIIRGSGLSRTLVVRRCLDLKGRIKPHHNIIILTCNLPYHQLCQYSISYWNVFFCHVVPKLLNFFSIVLCQLFLSICYQIKYLSSYEEQQFSAR